MIAGTHRVNQSVAAAFACLFATAASDLSGGCASNGPSPSGSPGGTTSSGGGGTSSSGGSGGSSSGASSSGDSGAPSDDGGGAVSDAASDAQTPEGDAPTSDGEVLDQSAILAAQGLNEPQWYEDNIPFIDTPDSNIDQIYYYRWSTFKRALRYTTTAMGYVSTEYDVENWYSGSTAYGALSDAAGYHILDGRWLRSTTYTDDYINYWLNGTGITRGFSEWIASASYNRYLVTGDAAILMSNLQKFIGVYNAWTSDHYSQNITVNGKATTDSLYFQTPVSDATEYTETSMHSTDWFGGGSGFRPTINSYQYGAALAISAMATLANDTADATAFAAKAAAIKAAFHDALWDPQRQFFMEVYDNNSSNVGLAWTRTTWREEMGFTPWAFELTDSTDPKYSAAWQYVADPQRFEGAYGLVTLERVHDFEAEQATIVDAQIETSTTASNGQYVGQITNADSSVTFTVDSPGPGTYPVYIFYANGSGAPATQNLVVNGGPPSTVSYPTTSAGGAFTDSQKVTVQVSMKAGANSLTLTRGTGSVDLDRIAANPYFDYQAIPAMQTHNDASCCHWDGPSWPFDTSMVLKGLANLLQDYPTQSYVTNQTYYTLLSQFATEQHLNGKPYVAEAANGDTGDWIYDASDLSENYNHSSFVDLVLTGLLGIQPQSIETLVLKPLVPASWTYFAVQDLPYHGHKLSIIWDQDGTHYHAGSGLAVFQDGKQVYRAATLGKTTIPVGSVVVPQAPTPMINIATNAWTADQEWLSGWTGATYTATYPKISASFTNPTSNGLRCQSGSSACIAAYDTPLKAIDGFIRYDVMPDNRWTNAGSTGATDSLTVDFGQQKAMSELKIYTYDNGQNVLVPQSYDIQTLSGTTWTTVPGQVKNPATPAANQANEVTFPSVTTSQFRVVFTPQSGKFVGVTEIECWVPKP